MQWDDIVFDTRILLQEKTESFFLTQSLKMLACEKQIEVARKTEALPTSTTIFFEPDTYEQDLPADFVLIEQVDRGNVGELYEKKQRPRDLPYPLGTPTHYYIWGKKIGLYPGAAGLEGTGTITGAGTTVTGTGTAFEAELQVGTKIKYDTQIRTVMSITNDTSLTVDMAFSPQPTSENFTYGVYIPIRYSHYPAKYGFIAYHDGKDTPDDVTLQITTTTVSLVITGGADAGTYTLTLSDYPTMTLLIAAMNAWGHGLQVRLDSSGAAGDPTNLEETVLHTIYESTKSESVYFFMRPELDVDALIFLKWGIIGDMRRRDNAPGKAGEMDRKYESEIVQYRGNMRLKRVSGESHSIGDAYRDSSYVDEITTILES